MLPALFLCLYCFLIILPSIIIRKFIIKAPLQRKRALRYSIIITVAELLNYLLLLFIISDLNSPSSWLLLLSLGVISFILNHSVLVKKKKSDIELEDIAQQYKAFFTSDMIEGAKHQPKGSLKKLYAKATEEGVSTFEYLSKYISPKVLTECKSISSNPSNLRAFLILSAQKGVIRESYIDILYYEYLNHN